MCVPGRRTDFTRNYKRKIVELKAKKISDFFVEQNKFNHLHAVLYNIWQTHIILQ